MLDWLTTVDHKKIGILYIVNSFLFFFAAGILALVIRSELAVPGLQFLDQDTYNQAFTMHGTIMLFLFVIPVAVRVRELHRAAPARSAGHGVPAHQRALVLAAAARRHPDLLGIPVRRRGRRGLDRLRAAHPARVRDDARH